MPTVEIWVCALPLQYNHLFSPSHSQSMYSKYIARTYLQVTSMINMILLQFTAKFVRYGNKSSF